MSYREVTSDPAIPVTPLFSSMRAIIAGITRERALALFREVPQVSRMIRRSHAVLLLQALLVVAALVALYEIFVA